MLPLPATGLSSRQVAETIDSSLGAVLKVRAAEAGATWPGLTPGAPLAPTSVPPFVASRDAVLAQAPVMTAVICTRERPLGLKACLDSLMQQHYPDYSVLVVDNAPATDASSRVVSEMQDHPVSVKYVVEPRRGLAWARNCALEMVPSGITAWIDDDEVADRYWLAELARGFAEHPDAAAVSGIMLPAELETQAQVWFEQYGGHHKHREFISTAFSPLTAAEQSPLLPTPALWHRGQHGTPRGCSEARGRICHRTRCGDMDYGRRGHAPLFGTTSGWRDGGVPTKCGYPSLSPPSKDGVAAADVRIRCRAHCILR